ncbi:hypothetical protein D3C81_2076530 [compost metagenome]|nr:Uncharacterised protein [Escherichia coli]
MHTRKQRGRHDKFTVIFRKTGNVLRDCAVKQLDILRKVADGRTQQFFIPLTNIRAVEPDFTR